MDKFKGFGIGGFDLLKQNADAKERRMVYYHSLSFHDLVQEAGREAKRGDWDNLSPNESPLIEEALLDTAVRDTVGSWLMEMLEQPKEIESMMKSEGLELSQLSARWQKLVGFIYQGGIAKNTEWAERIVDKYLGDVGNLLSPAEKERRKTIIKEFFAQMRSSPNIVSTPAKKHHDDMER
jgi:hypothetical protein